MPIKYGFGKSAMRAASKLKFNPRGINGFTPLHIAVQQGRLEIVDRILQHPAIDVNKVFKDKHTALTVACGSGHLEIVETLLKQNEIEVNKHFDTVIKDIFFDITLETTKVADDNTITICMQKP